MRRRGFTVIEGVVVLGLVLLLVTALASWRKNEQLLQRAAEGKMVSQQTIQRVWGLLKQDVERSDRCLETFGQWSANHQTLILNQPLHDSTGFPTQSGNVVVYSFIGNQLVRVIPQRTQALSNETRPESHFLFLQGDGHFLPEQNMENARQVEVVLAIGRSPVMVRRLRLSGGQ